MGKSTGHVSHFASFACLAFLKGSCSSHVIKPYAASVFHPELFKRGMFTFERTRNRQRALPFHVSI